MDRVTLDKMSRYTAALFADLGTPVFCERLLDLVRWQVEHDSVVIILYRLGERPCILHDRMDTRDREALLTRYFDGAYLLSPFYLHWQSGMAQAGLLRLAEIAPEGYFESIYYTQYYARSGLVDEVGYLIPLDESSGVLVSIGRTLGHEAFSAEELAFLDSLTPLMAAATGQYYARAVLPARQAMHTWLQDGLRLFGSSLLTEREQEVLQLMLRGHSSKSCARLLGISPTTERVHRRNIHTKLDISSQSELFVLFFDAISRGDLPASQDPLLHLHR